MGRFVPCDEYALTERYLRRPLLTEKGIVSDDLALATNWLERALIPGQADASD